MSIRQNTTTTDLKELAKGIPFTWGNIEMIYDIEDYTIAKYEKILNGESEGIAYYIWVEDKDTCYSSHTIEGAMAIAMAYMWEGVNSQAAGYFLRMIGAQED